MLEETGMLKSRFILFLLITLVGCASNQTKPEPPIDRISDAELSRIMLKPTATLSLEDIVKLSKDKTPPEQIIEKIKASNSYYELTPSQSLQLHQQGVSNKVLDYIHESREQALRNNVADEINKREKAKQKAEKQLERERNFYPSYGFGYHYWNDPFYWGPSFRYRYRRY
jgi:hypothetical protein